MIGEAADDETQQIRQAMLGQYINQLYQGAFEDWSKRHRDLLPEIQRMACAAHRWKRAKMPHGVSNLQIAWRMEYQASFGVREWQTCL